MEEKKGRKIVMNLNEEEEICLFMRKQLKIMLSGLQNLFFPPRSWCTSNFFHHDIKNSVSPASPPKKTPYFQSDSSLRPQILCLVASTLCRISCAIHTLFGLKLLKLWEDVGPPIYGVGLTTSKLAYQQTLESSQ
jgi:hypothetical protein